MATVTGMTADRMLAIEGASVVDGDVDGSGNLILTKHDGSQINAGSVIGPTGPQGPVGSDLVVASAVPVLDVGLVNQIRAGRQLTAADFTNMGLSAPLGLWNLSDLNDVSGNGRNLLNKGAVPFAAGINGVATTAAQFVGSTAQALYIPDIGAADSFRIKTGSWGCWVRTAKRATNLSLLGKMTAAAGQYAWEMTINANNNASIGYSANGSDYYALSGISDICDDRWHFIVGIHDGGSMRIYVDGVLEGSALTTYLIVVSSGVVNIGGRGADSSTATSQPHFGRIDEAFVTADVLSDDQIRNLYCAKIAHTLAAVPSRVSLNIRRRRRGATLVAADFSTQPLRLHNFSGGSLGDEGSGGVVLVNAAGAVSVAGVDGSNGNAFSFNGSQALTSTDAGLPAALTARSYGCWFKTTTNSTVNVMAWGQTPATNDARLLIQAGQIVSCSGPDTPLGPVVSDGQWHQAVTVEDNAAADGVKRKLYVDGRLVIASTSLVSIVLGGANFFRIGANSIGGAPFIGQLDGVFVLGYSLTEEQILTLYAKGVQVLTPSPKNSGDHVEAMSSTNLLATFDTLESQHQIDLRVAA